MRVEELFCKKCHRFITQYAKDKKGIQLVRNGQRVGASFSNNTILNSDGSTDVGIFFVCPAGHKNHIDDSAEYIAEQERLEYLCGTICFYHYREGTICDRKQECRVCIVYQNYLERSVLCVR